MPDPTRASRIAGLLLALLAPDMAHAGMAPAEMAHAEMAHAACADGRLPGARPRVLLLAEGDSITFGQQSSDGRSYVQRACLVQAKGIETVVAAVSRAVLGGPSDPPGANSLYGRMGADNARLAGKRGRLAVLTILIGRNDLVGYDGGAKGYADALAAYVRAMRRAGWDRVIVGTELPSTWEPFDPQRDDLDAILLRRGWARAHGIDAIADFAAQPEMGRDGAAADKTLYADGIHPNDHGYDLLAPIYDAALRKVLRHG